MQIASLPFTYKYRKKREFCIRLSASHLLWIRDTGDSVFDVRDVVQLSYLYIIQWSSGHFKMKKQKSRKPEGSRL